MDFNALKQKFFDVTKNVTEKAKGLGDTEFGKKTKEFGNKTLEFVGENLAKTPLFLQTDSDMNVILENKKVILLAFDERTDVEKNIMLNFPIWQTQAWTDSAVLRYLNHEKSERLIDENKFELPVEMRIYFHGEQISKINDIETIKKWWAQKERDYEKVFGSVNDDEKTKEKNENVDPLFENLK